MRFRFKHMKCREFGTPTKPQQTLGFVLFSRLRAPWRHRKIWDFWSAVILRCGCLGRLFGAFGAAPGPSKTGKHTKFLIGFGKGVCKRRQKTLPKHIEKRLLVRCLFLLVFGPPALPPIARKCLSSDPCRGKCVLKQWSFWGLLVLRNPYFFCTPAKKHDAFDSF